MNRRIAGECAFIHLEADKRRNEHTICKSDGVSVATEASLTQAYPLWVGSVRVTGINKMIHSCTVDVKPDDQLLLLVTCTEKDNERRVIAARKLRDGETEQELKKQVEKSWKK